MWLACIGACIAFLTSINLVKAATAETLWLEIWRMFGFLVFAGMFMLLALRPRLSAGVWELAFFHKAAVSIYAFIFTNAREAQSAGSIDAALAVIIVIAYVCTRGWLSWKVKE